MFQNEKIYKRFDAELKNIHQLGEKYTIEVSPFKLQSLVHRLNLLDIEFNEHFSELCTLRVQIKRVCHKCPNQTQLKCKSMENYCSVPKKYPKTKNFSCELKCKILYSDDQKLN